MKTRLRLIVNLTLCLLSSPSLLAQFISGSSGSDGPLTVMTDTILPLPDDGVVEFTTVNVAQGATLRFAPNALNTPVHVLATGDVLIAGTIDVSGEDPPINPPTGGRGGPGGFKGGEPGIPTSAILAGAGLGPGAGRGGTAGSGPGSVGAAGFGGVSQSTATTNNGRAYGTPLLIPLIGGSGGGGTAGPGVGVGGGGGGGGVLIASTTRITVSGRILAQGGARLNVFNSGSGGAIRLVAPAVAGTGELNVASRQGLNHGRIRIDALDRSGVRFNLLPATAATLGLAMVGIPNPLPRLDLIEVAGMVIAEGAPQPVTLTLPFGSNPNRTVLVQARDFNAMVPIQVVLTPERGSPSSADAVINNLAANPAQVAVSVMFPTNVPTAVHVWTR